MVSKVSSLETSAWQRRSIVHLKSGVESISSLEPLGLIRLSTPPPVATLPPTMNTLILIGQKIYRFKLISLAYKETQVRKICGIERLGAKR